MTAVRTTVNGTERALEVSAGDTLLDTLREDLRLLGTKRAAWKENAVPVPSC